MIGLNVNGLRGPAVAGSGAALPPQPHPATSVSPATPAAQTSQGSQATGKDDRDHSEKVLEALNAAGASLPNNSRLAIRVDREANRYVYEFRDPDTGDVLAQYPDKEVLAALAASRQATTGLTIDQSA